MFLGLTLGAMLLFFVGFEVGRVVNIDGYGAFVTGLVKSPKKPIKSLKNSIPDAEFKFFRELDAPAEARNVRKLSTPKQNANEMNASWHAGYKPVRARKRRAREARRLARMERPSRRDSKRSDRSKSTRTLKRKPSNVVAAMPQQERSAAPAPVERTLKRAPAPKAKPSGPKIAAAFPTLGQASKLKKHLQSQGKKAHISLADVPGKGKMYRVHVTQ